MNSPDDEMAQAFGISPPWSICPRTDLPNHWLSPARSLHLSTPQKQERRQFHTDLRQTEMSATIKLTHYCRLVRTTNDQPVSRYVADLAALRAFPRVLEAVHAHAPLQCHDGALHRLQETDRQGQRGRQP